MATGCIPATGPPSRWSPWATRPCWRSWAKASTPGVNDRLHQLAGLVREASVPGVTDLVPPYATLAVHYEPAAWAGL